MMEYKNMIKTLAIVVLLSMIYTPSIANDDTRELVKLPEMMQNHMLSNMRNHLATINEILAHMTNNELGKAGELAEQRLGMSSLGLHNAKHMAKFMPEGMQQTGTSMHKAASRFALKAEEGELASAYKALQEITSACVACHSAYRIH